MFSFVGTADDWDCVIFSSEVRRRIIVRMGRSSSSSPLDDRKPLPVAVGRGIRHGIVEDGSRNDAWGLGSGTHGRSNYIAFAHSACSIVVVLEKPLDGPQDPE